MTLHVGWVLFSFLFETHNPNVATAFFSSNLNCAMPTSIKNCFQFVRPFLPKFLCFSWIPRNFIFRASTLKPMHLRVKVDQRNSGEGLSTVSTWWHMEIPCVMSWNKSSTALLCLFTKPQNSILLNCRPCWYPHPGGFTVSVPPGDHLQDALPSPDLELAGTVRRRWPVHMLTFQQPDSCPCVEKLGGGRQLHFAGHQGIQIAFHNNTNLKPI